MPTQFPDFFAALAAPFDASEVKIRTQAGRQLHYITARVVMNRLDTVAGPENWWDDYTPHENSVLCRLTIRLPDGTTLTKYDAGGYAGMADSGDDDKSGYSDAYKRAAVKFGVARYLYRDGVPDFVRERYPDLPTPEHRHQSEHRSQPEPRHQDDDGRRAVNEQFRQSNHAPDRQQGERKQYDGPPRSGKALFAWVKDQEQRQGVELLKHLNAYAKSQNLPGRMVDWQEDEVADVYAEACRKLESLS
jgi:hypothetical protein